ncbi:unnamed protein product [Rotaria socialis]|uniref:Condensation domain-containing protein n=1 Tax=Rotaria socialis TaxID=392032 RepID=A0A821LB39_9BILA|nr:unnamed protein product [Rotaria socialis]CAF4747752.1 unnamed protein product [Rotaria socialis]
MNHSVVSFAQERIWFDEKLRFESNSRAAYNVLFVYKVNSGNVSIDRLCRALSLIISKHASLRTSLVYDDKNQKGLQQKVQSINDSLSSVVKVTHIVTDNQLNELLLYEKTNRSIFNLEKGEVFRCNILLRRPNDGNNDCLEIDDIVTFNFHHICFDGTSEGIFFDELIHAYAYLSLDNMGKDVPTYLDYATHEKHRNLSLARNFWMETLAEYEDSHSSILFDHPASFMKALSGHGAVEFIEVCDPDIISSMLNFAKENHVSLYQLLLTVYFTLLYKMTDSKDIVIAGLAANRPHHSLQSLIGMFANLLPYRLKINPKETFNELLLRVQQLCVDILPYINLPFQHILQCVPESFSANPMSLISTSFQVELHVHRRLQLKIGGNREITTSLTQLERSELSAEVVFPLAVVFEYDMESYELRGLLKYSTDLFDRSTIQIISRRWQLLIKQLFEKKSSEPATTCIKTRKECLFQQCRSKSIYTLNVLLDEEKFMLRQLNNDYIDKSIFLCNHQMFANQADEHPQKLAMTLEQQCLTYAETLHYSQHLAKYLIGNEIICQLLERSIEMIIGILAIWMSGGIYTPLNPRDPLSRIELCIKKIRARLILVHDITHHILPIEFPVSVINIEHIISSTSNNDDHDFSTVSVTPEHISHIVFTSGSTGTPKAVSLLIFENRDSRIDE